jgi:hypothetical protein
MAGISYSVPAAMIGALLALHGFATPLLLASTLACRAGLFYEAPVDGGRRLRDLPVALTADCLLFALWCASFMSRRVRWRDARFDVGRDGSAVPLMTGASEEGHATAFARGDARPPVISTGELL